MKVQRIARRNFLAALGLSATAMAVPRRIQGFALASIAPDLAHDADRPEYHFIAPRNWMNDPNGPIFWKGKYHLFYQWAPNSAAGGPPNWGHAISADMVHWRHLPIALAPTPGGADRDGCWTGSAIVRDGVPTVIYTGVIHQPEARGTDNEWRQAQMLATAEDDELLHWKKWPEPVVEGPPAGMRATGFRDPCPWREADGWYLVVGSGERDKGGCVLLYRSQDLRKWEYLHPLVQGHATGNTAPDSVDRGDMWECPDFFEVNGQHCLLYSSENKVGWSTGEYDRKEHRFVIKRQGVIDHGGNAYYAPKSFSAQDGRRVLWGWVREMRLQAEYVAAGWAGAISLPRVLTIGKQGQLEMNPAVEVEALRGAVERIAVKQDAPFKRQLAALRQELHVPMSLSHTTVTVRLLAGGKQVWELAVDVAGNAVRCGRFSFPLPSLPWPRPGLRLFLDGSVIETFVGGREAMTSRVYGLKPGETELEVAVTGRSQIEFEMWPLNAISPDRLTT
jgi:beta-fructofuranosidase